MFGIGGTEIIVILIVALIAVGPDRLPEAARSISKGIRDLKRSTRDIQNTIENDEHIGGAIRDIKSALRGEDPPPRAPTVIAAALSEGGGESPHQNYDEQPDLSLSSGAAGSLPPSPQTGDQANSSVRLPAAAGEVAAHHVTTDQELASLIKPAAGTSARHAGPAVTPVVGASGPAHFREEETG